MKCLREASILSKHHVHAPALVSTARRNASSKHGKPYELTPLVLDLDAADNTRIREVKDIPTEPWKGSERFQARIDKLTEIERTKRSRLEKRHELRKQLSFDTLIVTPPDLIQRALLGDPYRQSVDVPTGYLKGISSSLTLHKKDTERFKLWTFIENLPENGELAQRRAGFGDDGSEDIFLQMKDRPLFKRLRRTVTILSQTKKGCEYIIEHAKDFRYILKRSTNRSSQNTEVLFMINNLVANIHSKGLEIGPTLCNLGLYYASLANSHLAVRKYLNIAIRNSYQSKYHARMAALRLAVPMGTVSTPKSWFEDAEDTKRDALTLLTGWESNGVPSGGEIRQPSFAVLAIEISLSRSLYLAYIQALGELQATDALWQEFKTAQSNVLLSSIISTPELYEAFMTAFIIAHDPNSAAKLVDQANESSIDLSSSDVSVEALQSLSPVEKLGNRRNEKSNTDLDDPVIPTILGQHLDIRSGRNAARRKEKGGRNDPVVQSIDEIRDPKERLTAIEKLVVD